MGLNIIGDIAGNYLTLIALLKKMPDDLVLSVGDILDRGPRSKEVIDFFMAGEREGKTKTLLGNHEHLCVDYCQHLGLYQSGIWLYNGGATTLTSYGLHMPEEVVTWISRLPLYYIYKDYFIGHSFQSRGLSLKQSCDVWIPQSLRQLENTIIWNRSPPARGEKFQIAGHNSHVGFYAYTDSEGDYAICLDSSRDRILTGIHLPDRTIYQQEYID